MKKHLSAMAAALATSAVLVGFSIPAQAGLMMCLYLGPAVGCNAVPAALKTVVADDSALDLAKPLLGTMSVVSVIAGYAITINGGSSKPITTMDLTAPVMTLSSNVSVLPGIVSDLNIELSDDGWGPSSSTLDFFSQVSSADINTNAINFDAFWDPGNGLFARTNLLSSLGPINGTPGTNADSTTTNLGLAGASPYSITLVGTISGATTTSSFTSSITGQPGSTGMPEPASLVLLASGCLGMYAARSRRRRRAA